MSVINHLTGRKIKIGSNIYLKLVNYKIILSGSETQKYEYKTDNKLKYILKSNISLNQIIYRLQEINLTYATFKIV